MMQRTIKSATVTSEHHLGDAPAEAEIKIHANSRKKEEHEERLEALNCFHDEHGHFSDEYRTF
ncbi:TPA: type II toxin-antitoxin system CcdA family antitoxin [Klebsiella michiganensis]|nr:type II toxin-antitoxin system CcdA family antitoxin [Klebsiella michiganensis]